MHWNVEQILWALILAAHLVLAVVLLGRDRTGRFPWFTAAIALSAAHLIADHLLNGKLTSIAFYWESFTAVLIESIVGVLVLLELARKVFSSGTAGLILTAKGWLGWTMVLLGVTVGAVWLWGPWPTWQALSADPRELPLLLMVLAARKSQLFLALATVQIGLLLRIFGKRFGSGWTSHPQQIALGLSTYSLGYLAVQATTDIIRHTVRLTSRQQYEHIVKLFANLDNARFALWLVVLVWWIAWLWRDEPGIPLAAGIEPPPDALSAPAEPLSLEAETPQQTRQDDPEADPQPRD